jgi:hypothetical protein
MRNVTITRKVTLTLTAEDWQLYTDMPNINIATSLLNRDIELILNNMDDITQARRECLEVLREYSMYGAFDTEPCGVLQNIINEVYK